VAYEKISTDLITLSEVPFNDLFHLKLRLSFDYSGFDFYYLFLNNDTCIIKIYKCQLNINKESNSQRSEIKEEKKKIKNWNI
jgi:hypothetical protein